MLRVNKSRNTVSTNSKVNYRIWEITSADDRKFLCDT